MSAKSQPRKRKVQRKKSGGAPGRERSPRTPETASRYTPPARAQARFRPRWHKVAGVAVVPVGFALFVACRFNLGNIHAYGGHTWYLLGFAIMASSLWWWGAFDPPGSGFTG